MSEIWKAVPDYPMYEVSTHGRVRSWKSGRFGRRKEPRALKPWLDRDGYSLVGLYKNGHGQLFRVHLLVLTTYVGPCPPGLECCHSDGEPAHNYLSNLRWDTHAANMQDAISHGTYTPPNTQGEASGMAKLAEADVIEIRRAYAVSGITQAALGARFGVAHTTISSIIHRKTWFHLE